MYFEIEHYTLTEAEDELKTIDQVKELLNRGILTYRNRQTEADSWDIAEYMCRLIWTVIDDDAEKNDPRATDILENCIDRLHMLIKESKS